MKEIDFLPEWYKESKRRRSHVRRQYAVLAIAFIAMLSYNLTSTHRIARANASLARLEGQWVEAQAVVDEFDGVTKALNKVREKAGLIERIDSKINVAAVLAEMSHIIGETIVLSHVEFTAEPLSDDAKGPRANENGVRIADGKAGAASDTVIGNVRFRIVLTGVAVSPADVAALVRRLGDSSYFNRVNASFWRSGKVQVSAKAGQAGSRPSAASVAAASETLEVTEFEVVCCLANYKEGDGR